MPRRRSRARRWTGASALLFGAAGACVAQSLPDTSLSLDPSAVHRADDAWAGATLTPWPTRAAQAPLASPDPAFVNLLFDEVADRPLALEHADADDPDVSLNVGRSTVLVDGGIGDTGTALPDEEVRRERQHSYAQGDAEFDLYDLSLEWPAVSSGPMTLSLIGGLRAISAQAGQRVDQQVSPGQIASTYDESRGLITVPIVGTGVRVDLGDGVYLAGAAATHTIPEGATLLDFTAQTGVEFSRNVAFFAGYQMIRSSVDVGAINAELDQEGLFARLRVRF